MLMDKWAGLTLQAILLRAALCYLWDNYKDLFNT